MQMVHNELCDQPRATCQLVGHPNEISDICKYFQEVLHVKPEIVAPYESIRSIIHQESTPLILCVKAQNRLRLWDPPFILPENFKTIENLAAKYHHLRGAQGFNDYFLLASLAGRKVVVLYFDWERDEGTQRNAKFLDSNDENESKVAILHNNERILSSYHETRQHLSKFNVPLPLFLSWSGSNDHLTVQQQLALQQFCATAPDKTIDVDFDKFYEEPSPENFSDKPELFRDIILKYKKKQYCLIAALVFLSIVVFVVALLLTGTSDTKVPTMSPTRSPTILPIRIDPSDSPTAAPIITPTDEPTDEPTPSPTISPTPSPTISPTPSPTISPTPSPTTSPTPSPTISPTPSPTISPTPSPTISPTLSPTISPTLSPTISPTLSPTISPIPSPTALPTPSPTPLPTPLPTPSPTREFIEGLQKDFGSGESPYDILKYHDSSNVPYDDTKNGKMRTYWLQQYDECLESCLGDPNCKYLEYAFSRNKFTECIRFDGPPGRVHNSTEWYYRTKRDDRKYTLKEREKQSIMAEIVAPTNSPTSSPSTTPTNSPILSPTTTPTIPSTTSPTNTTLTTPTSS